MKTAIFLATRPEITRMSPVIHECKKRGLGILANSDDARNPQSEPYRDLLVDAGCTVAVHISMCRSIRAWIFRMSCPML